MRVKGEQVSARMCVCGQCVQELRRTLQRHMHYCREITGFAHICMCVWVGGCSHVYVHMQRRDKRTPTWNKSQDDHPLISSCARIVLQSDHKHTIAQAIDPHL